MGDVHRTEVLSQCIIAAGVRHNVESEVAFLPESRREQGAVFGFFARPFFLGYPSSFHGFPDAPFLFENNSSGFCQRIGGIYAGLIPLSLVGDVKILSGMGRCKYPPAEAEQIVRLGGGNDGRRTLPPVGDVRQNQIGWLPAGTATGANAPDAVVEREVS